MTSCSSVSGPSHLPGPHFVILAGSNSNPCSSAKLWLIVVIYNLNSQSSVLFPSAPHATYNHSCSSLPWPLRLRFQSPVPAWPPPRNHTPSITSPYDCHLGPSPYKSDTLISLPSMKASLIKLARRRQPIFLLNPGSREPYPIPS
jgi:hypothetical protein